MKVHSINSYNSNIQKSKYSSELNFKGQLQLKEVAKNTLNKKNVFNITALTLLVANLLKLFGVEFSDILENLSTFLVAGWGCMTESPKQYSPPIEFKKAETIEDAKKYAQEKLHIKKFNIKDLEYANWVNEALTNIFNRFNGQVYFPNSIRTNNLPKKSTMAFYLAATDSIWINKKSIEKDADKLKDYINKYPYEVLTKYNLGKGYEKFCEKLKIAYENPDSLSIFEKCSLTRSLSNAKNVLWQIKENGERVSEPSKFNKHGNIYVDEFEIIYHEIGHCFDLKSNMFFKSLIDRLKHKKELKSLTIPSYPKTNTSEFIAHIFSGIMQGENYSPEIMNLFNKLIEFKINKNV